MCFFQPEKLLLTTLLVLGFATLPDRVFDVCHTLLASQIVRAPTSGEAKSKMARKNSVKANRAKHKFLRERESKIAKRKTDKLARRKEFVAIAAMEGGDSATATMTRRRKKLLNAAIREAKKLGNKAMSDE